MSSCRALRFALMLLVCASASTGGCRGALSRTYEYEEDVHLALDGSATIYVNASVPALVALRGVDLPLDPRARLDRAEVRAIFESPVTRVANVSTSRRDGRRYVHVRIETPDIRRLSTAAPFAWSTYHMESQADLYVYKQQLGASAGKSVGDVGWTGQELVAFRLHLPSRVTFQNQQDVAVQRGNIIPWEQPLTARLAGAPISIEVQMEQDSILFKTLGLFGLMMVLVVITFVVVIWLVMRRGRQDEFATKTTKTI